MDIAVGTIVGLLCIVFAVRLLIRLPRRARSKGYRNIYGGSAAAIIFWSYKIDTGRRFYNDLLFGAVAVAIVLFQALIIHLLPQKDPRPAGPRVLRFPYRAVGWFLIVAGIVGGLTFLVLGWPVRALRTAMGLVGTGAILISIAIRAAATSQPQTDSRAPVLYLRPFRVEARWFAELLVRPRDYYTPPSPSWFHDPRFPTFEQFFSVDIGRSIGPLIALGNPEDFVPPTAALPRKYVADKDWQDEFQTMAAKAACILAVADFSDNLVWELELCVYRDCSASCFS